MTVSLAACGGKTNEPKDDSNKKKGEVSISWWGGDERHTATIAAIDKFKELNPDIKVTSTYSAWTGWEDKMSTQFYSKSAPDVNQINWNWITSFSSDGSAFADLNDYSEIIDLTQFPKEALEKCTIADKLQGIPIAMTGRIFYYNKTTFDKAGISVPTSYEELLAAGKTFKEKLGDEYYPLVLTELDRMFLMVSYLQSVYGKEWVEDGKLQYNQKQIEEGMEFIQGLEKNHVIPAIQTVKGDGAESMDKNPKWMEGTYAGILEWDTSANKFKEALNEGQEFVVGDFFKDFGKYQGGMTKVSMAFAISESASDKEASAKLINFLLNDPEGVALMGSERGVPLSAIALKTVEDKGLLDETVAQANEKVMEWSKFSIDPMFEDSKLKAEPDGLYWDVMAGLSYGDYDVKTAAEMLIEGVDDVLSSKK